MKASGTGGTCPPHLQVCTPPHESPGAKPGWRRHRNSGSLKGPDHISHISRDSEAGRKAGPWRATGLGQGKGEERGGGEPGQRLPRGEDCLRARGGPGHRFCGEVLGGTGRRRCQCAPAAQRTEEEAGLKQRRRARADSRRVKGNRDPKTSVSEPIPIPGSSGLSPA